ncbi:MAG: DUF1800 domain-containing protein, partial [Pseudomonadota bacterium]
MTIEAAIALNRFGLGAKRNEIDRVSDPHDWLRRQIQAPPAHELDSSGLKLSKDHFITLQSYFAERRKGRTDRAAFDEDKLAAFRGDIRKTAIAEISARTQYGVSTDTPFYERLVRFWANHFSVSGQRPQTSLVVGAYHREAIRPNILGRFVDLAAASILHPAMLAYLDNWQSVGPNSFAGKRRGRGLNENLAREALELHTVTQASGYTQDDVTELARALTGWTIGNERLGGDRKGEVLFSNIMHEPGSRMVLGKRYSETGKDQAKAILADLCRREETARNIGFKLARHFVSDAPPALLVERLKQTFLNTDGDLKAVYRTLIDTPEAWSPHAQKLKTPDELLTSTARLIGIRRVHAGDPRSVYESLAQRPFSAP